ncbi:GntR family transcriptional regulator [Streptomyces sp. NBC_00056]|uniref:GntR family transcriptional regulator n=1 Tax=unclassified Streptomyces TaxID=2593676 RepID=UPI00224D8CEE|nr:MULTISPECIES: GntR family transcriptional regulator [unclassified Streptomyces]MCX5438167.1 GntR family transcriptional regulator [Streptomyces sp. NBC_00063]WUB95278.1 GntR family transcriptional regulator [Streptomyces sp. NBC_00569]
MAGGRGRDGGREAWRVAEELRARLADGTYPVGSLIPPQRELADRFRVSRDTVQRALKELAGEGWIESRQGSGSRVLKNQRIQSYTAKASHEGRVSLGPLISEAFEQPEVTLDVYTLTSESLDTHIRVQAERIRSGEIAPEKVEIRILLPSESLKLPYPQAKDDPDGLRLRERLLGITRRHTVSIRRELRQLRAEGLVPVAEFQVRHVPLTPAFKLYLLNGGEALHGPYEVIERPIVLDSGEEILALDVLGLGATLTHYVRDGDPNSRGSVFVESMGAWFDSVWNLIAER